MQCPLSHGTIQWQEKLGTDHEETLGISLTSSLIRKSTYSARRKTRRALTVVTTSVIWQHFIGVLTGRRCWHEGPIYWAFGLLSLESYVSPFSVCLGHLWFGNVITICKRFCVQSRLEILVMETLILWLIKSWNAGFENNHTQKVPSQLSSRLGFINPGLTSPKVKLSL